MRQCSECGTEMEGRLGRLTCSARCRVARSRRLRKTREDRMLTYDPADEPVVLDPDDPMMCDRCLRDRKRRQVKRVEGQSHKGGTFYIWVCKAGCEFVR